MNSDKSTMFGYIIIETVIEFTLSRAQLLNITGIKVLCINSSTTFLQKHISSYCCLTLQRVLPSIYMQVS